MIQSKSMAYKKLFILSIVLVLIVCVYFLTSGPSAATRFNNGTGLELPKKFIVLRDEYQDMGPDYKFYYDIELDKDIMLKFLSQIKNSTFYLKDSIDKPLWDKSPFYTRGTKAIWTRTASGYYFRKIGKYAFHSLFVDTVSNVIYYQESMN